MTVLDMRRLCEWCGSEIPDHKRAHAMFCSRACKRAEWLHVDRQGRLDDKRNRPPCLHCGGAIPPEATAKRIFCSLACQRKHLYRRRVEANPAKTCPSCGTRFHPTQPEYQTCSPACARVQQIEPPRPCERCGTVIEKPGRGRRFCSNACSLAARRARRGRR